MTDFDYQYGKIETHSSIHNFDEEISRASIVRKIGELFVDGKKHAFKLDQIKSITLYQSVNGIKREIPILKNGDRYERFKKN